MRSSVLTLPWRRSARVCVTQETTLRLSIYSIFLYIIYTQESKGRQVRRAKKSFYLLQKVRIICWNFLYFWKFGNLARNCEGCTIFAFRVVVKYTNNNRKSSSILRIVVSFRFQEGIFFFYIIYYVSPRASTTIRGCVEICIYIVPPSTFSSCSYYHLYTNTISIKYSDI